MIALALLLPSSTLATPITFALDHGSVTAKIWAGGSVVASGAGSLDAGFVTLDTATGQLPGFSLHSSGVGFWATILPGAYNALTLDVSINPGAGYASSASGSNPWNITLGPIEVAYSGIAFDATTPVTVPPIAVGGVIPVNTFGVTAYFNAGQMRLGLFGVKIGEVWVGGTIYEVRADIEFVGFAVPEPASAGLIAAALASLVGWRARRIA